MGEHVRDLPGVWTARQLKIMELLSDPYDKRSIAEKAQEIGVHEQTVYQWKRLPGWKDAVFDMAKSHIGHHAPKVLMALCNKAQQGDFACIKLYLELIGKYVPRQETDLKVGRLEQLSDAELRDIIERGASPESGGSNGNGEKAEGKPDSLLPPAQSTGEVSQEPSDN